MDINSMLEPLGGVFDNVTTFFGDLSTMFNYSYIMGAILVLSMILLVLILFITTVKLGKTYESQLLRTVIDFNKYFTKVPNITEENLIEINNRFKRVPKIMRTCWQNYMINRDKKPSEFLNSVTCVDQPSRSSDYAATTNVSMLHLSVLAFVTFIFNFMMTYACQSVLGAEFSTISGLFYTLFAPLVIVIVGYIFIAFYKSMQAKKFADLYYQFNEFERFIDKACETMPQVVDYEVLFTPQEIKNSIPVLQEYLEKRAEQESKEAELAQLNANHFENFDFSSLGVESQLLMDRAMLESEKFFNVKRGMTERITAKETEMYNFQKQFDEVTKDFDRKTQTIKENMDQLTQQLNETTVKIEANYLKKRYNEEQQKLQQFEKDYEYANNNFAKQQREMEDEIAQYQEEIAAKKETLVKNMMAECQSYANKVWGNISSTLNEQYNSLQKETEEKVAALETKVEDMNAQLEHQDEEMKIKAEKIMNLEQDIRVRIAEVEAINNVREYLTSTEFRQKVKDGKRNKKSGEPVDDITAAAIAENIDNGISQIVNSDTSAEALQQRESELLDKVGEVETEAKKLHEQNKLLESQKAQEKEEVNPFAAFAEFQKDIGEDETEEAPAEEVGNNEGASLEDIIAEENGDLLETKDEPTEVELPVIEEEKAEDPVPAEEVPAEEPETTEPEAQEETSVEEVVEEVKVEEPAEESKEEAPVEEVKPEPEKEEEPVEPKEEKKEEPKKPKAPKDNPFAKLLTKVNNTKK